MLDYRILALEETTSTNDEAMSHPQYGQGTIVTARRQSAGRGQRGNRWESAPGENLTFSLALEPTHIPVEEQFRISEMAAVAAARAIREITREAVSCRVKWPNDLYVADRKVGGILIEHCFHSEYLSRSVIGIGINIRQTRFDSTLPNPTSLALELENNPAPAPDEVLMAFQQQFSRLYTCDPREVHRCYLDLLWRGDGAYYPFRDTRETFEARIADIDPASGRLTLEDRSGTLRRYWFKEVEAVL